MESNSLQSFGTSFQSKPGTVEGSRTNLSFPQADPQIHT